MKSRVTVKFDGVSEVAARLADAMSAIEATLATLDRESALLGSRWTGEASDAYVTAKHEWRASMVEINAFLGDAIRELEAANTRYKTADLANGTRWII